MIKAGQLSKGMFILVKDAPYEVTEREFVYPGKGTAFIRAKLKNMKTGQVLKQVIKSQEQVEDIEVTELECQFLYSDGETLHFMNSETYEQFGISAAVLDDKAKYLKEGDTYELVMWEDEPLNIKLPFKMKYAVTQAEDAVKGDTVTGATKTVEVETGLTVKVPLFIKEGDNIIVNTETGEYVERTNN